MCTMNMYANHNRLKEDEIYEFRNCTFRFKTVLTYFQDFKVHLETIFDVVKVVKVLQVSVTPLLQKVLLCLAGGL